MAASSMIMDIAGDSVDPEWMQFMQTTGLWNMARDILENLERQAGGAQTFAQKVCPAIRNIFAFARYPFSQTRVVIFGQDPYPNRENACGIAFGVASGARIPPSLAMIYRALVAQGLMRESSATCGNLARWCEQGVILANMALTTVVGESRAHYDAWKGFASVFAREVSKARPGMIFILLGGDAQKIKGEINVANGCLRLCWGHPSPMNSANRNPDDQHHFVKCTCFAATNNELMRRGYAPINWDPVAPLRTAPIAQSSTAAHPTSPVAQSSTSPSALFSHQITELHMTPEEAVYWQGVAIKLGTDPARWAEYTTDAELLNRLIHAGRHGQARWLRANSANSSILIAPVAQSSTSPVAQSSTAPVAQSLTATPVAQGLIAPVVSVSHARTMPINEELQFDDESVIVIFTDGATSRNGFDDAVAAFAVMICDGTYSYKISGTIAVDAKRTNQCAELCAMRDALLYANSEEFAAIALDKRLIIIYDSAYAWSAISEWFDNWKRIGGSTLATKSNRELIEAGANALKRVRQVRKVEGIHIKSHCREPVRDDDPMQWFYWRGNKEVDQIARDLVAAQK